MDFLVIKDFNNNEWIVYLFVDYFFVCVVDVDYYFEGIVIRCVVLK